jgi:hypothetical protein
MKALNGTQKWTVLHPMQQAPSEKKELTPRIEGKDLCPAPEFKNSHLAGWPMVNSRARGKGRKGRRNRKKVVPELPPPFYSSVTSHHVFHFSVTAAANGTAITWANIAGATGVIGTVTNSTAVGLCSSFKINRVIIYPAVNASAAGRQEVIFQVPTSGAYTKDESKARALPVGVTNSGPIVFVPPKESVVGDWCTAGSVGAVGNTILTMYCTAGSIVALDLSWTQSNNAGSASITGLTTVAVGTYYYLGLDGSAGNFPPIALPTTV